MWHLNNLKTLMEYQHQNLHHINTYSHCIHNFHTTHSPNYLSTHYQYRYSLHIEYSTNKTIIITNSQTKHSSCHFNDFTNSSKFRNFSKFPVFPDKTNYNIHTHTDTDTQTVEVWVVRSMLVTRFTQRCISVRISFISLR